MDNCGVAGKVTVGDVGTPLLRCPRTPGDGCPYGRDGNWWVDGFPIKANWRKVLARSGCMCSTDGIGILDRFSVFWYDAIILKKEMSL